MIKIDCPIHIIMPRKTMKDKKYPLNLNAYRNWCYRVKNDIKQSFTEAMRGSLSDLKIEDDLYITYKYYKASKRRSDKNNVISIVDKFFCDAMVDNEVLEDDNDNFIINTFSCQTEIDKENPRVEVKLFVDKKEFLEEIKKDLGL